MEILRKFRESLKLSQKEFADNIGVSHSLYEKVESGIRKPSRKFISNLKSKYPQFDTNIFLVNSYTKRAGNEQKKQTNLGGKKMPDEFINDMARWLAMSFHDLEMSKLKEEVSQ